MTASPRTVSGPEPSASARRFRLWLTLRNPALVSAWFVRHAVTLLTVAALASLFTGFALWDAWPLAFVVTGFLLALLTPMGAALRILIRGR